MFRTVSLSVIRSLALCTQQQEFVIQVILTACQQSVSITCMYCCVYSARLLMMDRKTVRNMYSPNPKNNFDILMHLVCFIIRIYHDALSSECQIRSMYLYLFISECIGIQIVVSLFKQSDRVQSRRYTNVTSEITRQSWTLSSVQFRS